MNEKFAINLLRLLAAQQALQSALCASREMLGRSYFSLGVAEKAAVDQVVFGSVAANYQALTPEFLEGPQALQSMGFPTQQQPPTPGTSPTPR